MFSFTVDEKQQVENIPISSVRIQLFPDDEKLMIRREAALDDPDIRFDLWDEIESIINRAENILQPSGQDRTGVIITGQTQDGTEIRIGISYRHWSQMNADLILHNIEQKLNSAETLYMNLTFTFSVRYMDGEFNLGKKIGWNGDGSWYASRKRCIIQIHPDKDPYKLSKDCLWQFLVLGYSWLVSKKEIVSNLQFINQETYKKLVSSSSKFKLRNSMSQLMRDELNVTKFEDIISTFEEKFNIQVVLYSLITFLKVEFPKQHLLPLVESKTTIFGLVTSEKDFEWEHVDFISNPTGLSMKKSECTRICYHCFEIYSRSRNCGNQECGQSLTSRCITCHTCSGVCVSCYNPECFQNSTFLLTKCNICNVTFQSQKCMEDHLNFCKFKKVKTCDICFRTQHRGLSCNEYNCMMCGLKETFENKENHQCFLKPQKMKKIVDSYWTYDFETCLNEDNDHVLYLATATCLYWKSKYENLKVKYRYKVVNNYIVFYFWGLNEVFDFFTFLCEDSINGSIFYAHNAGKYDSIFIEKYMFERKKLHCSKIQQGLRIMQLYYSQIEVTFRDSLLFIPTSLRSMSKDFGIVEIKKGFFPHKIMTVNFLNDISSTNYIIKPPERKFFEDDLSFYNFEKEKIELDEFFVDFYKNQFWNLKEDAIDYCISDTVLLAEVLKIFREKTFLITSDEFDVLNYVTLPSAVMKYFLGNFLQPKSISVIDRYSSLIKRESILWILWEQNKDDRMIKIQCINELENIPITGMFEKNIFIFHPCYDHGCKFCYRGNQRNFRSSKTFNECYLQNNQYENELRKKGYNVISIWEHEWIKIKETPTFLKWYEKNVFEIEENLPLDPREAYKGGVSELYKFSVKNEIQMVDFVSQYPTSLLGISYSPYTDEKIEWFLPTGCSRRVKPDLFQLSEKLAIIKCKILPPRQLYAPFLGYKASSLLSGTYEVIYGLCRTCMDYRNLHLCNHCDNDREFIGTWTSVEIHHALKLGYKISKVIDVWEYDEKSNSLFTSFIIPFMITKIISKKDGLVENNSFTEKGKLISEYVYEICGRQLSPDEFQNKPAERIISKLMMNSFYGKWGQRSNWPETSTFSRKEVEKCLKILSNPTYQILHGEVVKRFNESYVVLEFEKKISTVKGDSCKNDHIAAFVTAYGRIMLNELIQKLGNQIIYSDTDSAFLTREMELPFRTGFRIGDLELELEQGFNWSALGRKSYSFESKGKVICKQKGISLKNSMREKFTPDHIRKIFLQTKHNYYNLKNTNENLDDDIVLKKMKKLTEEGIYDTIIVNQRKFQSIREDRLTMKKQSIIQEKKTCFLMWGLKRIPLWENEENDVIDSLPFGYYQ